MQSTHEFLQAVKARHSVKSDYALAPLLGVTRASISRLQSGKDFMGDSTAIKVAKLLEIDARYVLACTHAERAKEETEKAVWQGFAALFPQDTPERFCIM